MRSITTILHLYYPGSWDLLKKKCAAILQESAGIIITACHDDVIQEIETESRIRILKVPNMGKDIGGKLAGFAYYQQFCERTDYLAFLHDKISPQTINAEYWQDKLYSLFDPTTLATIFQLFETNKKMGLAGSKAFLKNEYNKQLHRFNSTNSDLLLQQLNRYQLECRNYDFIAGTIFIVRSHIYERFFAAHSALDARVGLEKGNVIDLYEGTLTHCWERLFSFIVNHYDYEVRGIA